MHRLARRASTTCSSSCRAWWSKWISTFGTSSGDASVHTSLAAAATYVCWPFSNGAFRLPITGAFGIATID